MGRGGYNGGSTIVRPGSDWFSYGTSKGKKEKANERRDKSQGKQLEILARIAAAKRARISAEDKKEQEQKKLEREKMRKRELKAAQARVKKEKPGKAKTSTAVRSQRIKQEIEVVIVKRKRAPFTGAQQCRTDRLGRGPLR